MIFFFQFSDDMIRLNDKIDRLGTDMHWMRNALIEWTQAIEEEGQTNELIAKYCKEDQKKADVRCYTVLPLKHHKFQQSHISGIRS